MAKSKEQAKEEARKKQVEKVIKKNLPISWIKQPINLTFLRGDIDRLQLIVITMTMDKLQSRVNKWLAMSQSEKRIQPTLFTEEEMRKGMEPIQIPLNEYGIQRNHYDRIDKATDVLLAMHVDVIEGGDKVKRNLFSEVRIPTYETMKGEKRKKSYIEFKVNPDAMRTYYDMSRYNRYIKETVLNCKGRFTARIYMFITAYKFQNQKQWKVSYQDLRLMLGVDEQDGKNIVRNKYQVYTDFRKRVLNDSKSELDELQAENKVDCYFTFEEVFKNGVKRGDPEYIIFNILLTQLGKDDQLSHYGNGEISEILDRIGFSTSEKSYILRRAVGTDRELFLDKLRETERILHAKKDGINNPCAYAQAIINDFLSAFERKDDDIEDAQIVGQEPLQEEVTDTGKWNELCGMVRDRLGEEAYTTWFSPLSIASFEEGKLVLFSPSRFITDTIDERYPDQFTEIIEKVFGKGTALFWKL